MEAADRGEITTVFVDRDGTINEKAPEGDYVKSWPEFRFLPRAPEALGLLTERRRRVVIVTNQRGRGCPVVRRTWGGGSPASSARVGSVASAKSVHRGQGQPPR